MICPYEYKVPCNSIYPLQFCIVNGTDLVLAEYDKEYLDYCSFYTIKERGIENFGIPVVSIRPATRKEIQMAGFWDLVVNKDDFSSEDDELEEYLRLGEEE